MKIVPLTRKVRDRIRERTEQRPRASVRLGRWLTLAVIFILTVLVTSPVFWVEKVPTTPGSRIDRPIRAEVSFSHLPRAEYEQWSEGRRERHTRWFDYDSRIERERAELLDALLSSAATLAEQTPAGQPLDAAALRATLVRQEDGLGVWTDADLVALGALARDSEYRRGMAQALAELYTMGYVVAATDRALYEAYRPPVSQIAWKGAPPEGRRRLIEFPGEVETTLRNLVRRHLQEPLEARLVPGTAVPDIVESPGGQVSFRLLRLLVRRNLNFNREATERARDEFPPPMVRVFEAGSILAPQGMITRGMSGRPEDVTLNIPIAFPHEITAAEAELLTAYAQSLRQQTLLKFAAQVLFVLVSFLIVSFFLFKFKRELEFNSTTVMLLAGPVLLALVLGRLLFLLAGPAYYPIGYAFPAGLIGILAVLLLDVRLAILLVTWGCLLFGLEADLRFEYVIVGLFGGYTACAALYSFRERREVLYAGLMIGVVNATTILTLSYIRGWTDEAITAAAIGALSGVMCSLISFAVLPIFEGAFGVTTDMRLLELTGLQHVLLRELEEKAPGTWQHTLNVAKLAEEAATDIGVNYLMVRAACYFHDIGKMTKPEYFTENQLTPEDKQRHAGKKPQMSALIIKKHVKDGIELAKQHNLPAEVAAFIPEHHGTSLIQYFYLKALTAYEKGESKEPVREEDYRYPGPKPQTIESALVMLADTVEATATAKLSGRGVRDDELQMLVRTAVFEKFNDGQFDECNLTMRDLTLIRESFVKTLRSRFHSRIDYPERRKTGAPTSQVAQMAAIPGTTSSEVAQPTPMVPAMLSAMTPGANDQGRRPSRDVLRTEPPPQHPSQAALATVPPEDPLAPKDGDSDREG